VNGTNYNKCATPDSDTATPDTGLWSGPAGGQSRRSGPVHLHTMSTTRTSRNA